jgi:hypothetical protein
MSQLTEKIKPKNGFSSIVHIILTSLLPALLFVFVSLQHVFDWLAVALIILSKWRMFAVKPRHWLANIRANAIDIIVGLSALTFMINSHSQLLRLVWAIAYGLWLLILKPKSTTLAISLQAIIGQFVGLIAVFIAWGGATPYVLIIVTWLVCYAAARHFFANFEEGLIRYLSYAWGYFAAAMVWISSHWLIFYGYVAQPALLISVVGFGLGSLYYLDKTDRMSVVLRRQILFVMVAVVVIVLTFSQWGDKTI